jgi:threonine/homoserine/homoserine lactone efflux protein
MPPLHSLLLFIGAGLLLNLVPGQDVLYITGRSISQGRRAGMVSALGIGAGCLVHVAAAALGLSALMVALPAAFNTVRYLGAAYLVWLGIQALRHSSRLLTPETAPAAAAGRIFRQGMATNILNPKVALFFLAFLPQFTSPARGPLAPQILLLGLIFDANGTVVNVAYAVAAGWLGARLKARSGSARWLNRAMGSLFVALGISLALADRR